MVESDQLGDRPACGNADQVGGPEFVSIEDADDDGDEVAARVPEIAEPIGDRAAGVAVVATDDEPAAVGERPAEVVRPSEHRGAKAHDQQDRWLRGVAPPVGAEL